MNRTAAAILLSIAPLMFGANASAKSAAKTAIVTKEAPAAIGPYSQAIAIGQALYVSGQIPLDPATGALVAGDIKAQTAQVLKNLEAVLKAAGLTLDDVVSTTVYMTNLDEFPAMNEVYATAFKTLPPARATVGVAALPRKATVEISLIAARP